MMNNPALQAGLIERGRGLIGGNQQSGFAQMIPGSTSDNSGDDLIRAVGALNRAIHRATVAGWSVVISADEHTVSAKVSRDV